MRYNLRTLLTVMTLAPPLLAMAWFISGQIEFWLVLVGFVSLVVIVAAFLAAALGIVAAGIWTFTIIGERLIRLIDR